MKNIPIDCFETLANAIILQAVKDYRKALADENRGSQREIERFFHSDWFSVLTDTPSGGRNVHSKENIISKMVDMENELNSDIDKMVRIKKEVAETINNIDDRDCSWLLEMRYLRLMTWEDIAAVMRRSIRSIHYLHNQELKKVEKSLHTFAHNCT